MDTCNDTDESENIYIRLNEKARHKGENIEDFIDFFLKKAWHR